MRPTRSCAQLLARGLGFGASRETELPAEALQSVDTCWSLALGLVLIDVRAAEFVLRHVLQALDLSEPYRIVRGLALLIFQIDQPSRAPGLCKDDLAVVEEIKSRSEDPRVLAWAELAQAFASMPTFDLPTTMRHFEAAERIFVERCYSVSREVAICRSMMAAMQHMTLGAEVFRGPCQRWLRQAEDQDDLYLSSSLELARVINELALGRAELTLKRVDRVIPRWSSGVVNSLWISGAEARILTLCCLERFAEAVECADHAAERFFASPFALYPLQCFVILAARAVARLGLATNEESRRAALLALVEADADEIGRVHPLLASYGALMLAGVATLRGNRLEAKAQLAAAGAVVATEPGLPYWPLLAGYRLAELDGDVARQGEIKAHAAVLGLQLADFAAGLAPGSWQ